MGRGHQYQPHSRSHHVLLFHSLLLRTSVASLDTAHTPNFCHWKPCHRPQETALQQIPRASPERKPTVSMATLDTHQTSLLKLSPHGFSPLQMPAAKSHS